MHRILRRVLQHVRRERAHGPIRALMLFVELHREVLLEQCGEAEGTNAEKLSGDARIEDGAHLPSVILA